VGPGLELENEGRKASKGHPTLAIWTWFFRTETMTDFKENHKINKIVLLDKNVGNRERWIGMGLVFLW
jgi:hypothetical protein